jgi:hypothetical protein
VCCITLFCLCAYSGRLYVRFILEKRKQDEH